MASRIQGITVEIGGDTTKLSKALESVNKSIKGTQSGLKDVNKLLKLDPSNTELVVQKQKMLKDAIEATKEKLATLKTAAQQANEQLANGEITQQQYDALQREIVETEQNLRSLQDQAATTNATLAKIDEAGEKLQNIGSSVENVGKKFLPVTAAVTGLGTAAVKTAADFDSEMSKVSAISGATGDDFDQLRAKAREMGAKTKFSASEAASAMEYMAMAGWKTGDMLNGIEGIMNLAAASGEDLATTSDIVTDALTAFGLSAADEFEKNIDLTPLAETWECSTHPDGPSYVVGGAFDGQELAEVLRAHPEYLGERHKGENALPILIKFIDAKKDLSVQVHPTDVYAQEHENGQLGKTEMWYVLDAGREARLVYGLKQNCTKAEMRRAIADGTVMKYLQKVPIHKDDLFFIQAGTVHAIGAGALVAEIQENSNLTYRLYDYDRVGKDGKKRELHIDKALDVANLKSSAEPKQPLRVLKYRQGVASELLTRCKYFEVYRMIVNTERRQKVHYRADEIAFRVLLCVNGCGTISYEGGNLPFYKGDCIFVPADSEVLTIHGQAQFLDVRG